LDFYGKLCTEFYDADKKLVEVDGYELDIYKELFSINDAIIEPMCGSGRLLIPLMQLGYSIEGVDISKTMLENCKKRGAIHHLSPVLYNEEILNFLPSKVYQGLIIPLGSFQLLWPREKAFGALKKFHQWLAPDGKLVMDMFIPWGRIFENEEVTTTKTTLSNAESICLESNTSTNKFEQHSVITNKYVKNKDGEIAAEEDERLDILWYYPYEMELILEKYGFKNIHWRKRFINGDEYITFIASKGALKCK